MLVWRELAVVAGKENLAVVVLLSVTYVLKAVKKIFVVKKCRKIICTQDHAQIRSMIRKGCKTR